MRKTTLSFMLFLSLLPFCGFSQETDSLYLKDINEARTLFKNKKDDEAFKLLHKHRKDEAFAKDTLAMFMYGSMLNTGRGTIKDIDNGFKWLSQAEKLGSKNAFFLLGMAYYDGEGVTKDFKESFKRFKQAADAGYPAAALMLGIQYEEGEGVKKDMTEAVKYYRIAAMDGDLEFAYVRLAYCFYKGNGVKKDRTEAAKLYKKAAEMGSVEGELNTGLAYVNGEGVTQNQVEGFQWLMKAALKGNEKAQLNVGKCYLYGWGVELDKDKAKEWLGKARAQGSAEASTLLYRMDGMAAYGFPAGTTPAYGYENPMGGGGNTNQSATTPQRQPQTYNNPSVQEEQPRSVTLDDVILSEKKEAKAQGFYSLQKSGTVYASDSYSMTFMAFHSYKVVLIIPDNVGYNYRPYIKGKHRTNGTVDYSIESPSIETLDNFTIVSMAFKGPSGGRNLYEELELSISHGGYLLIFE